MRFTKMQGAGNDYIYVDCFANPMPHDPAGLSRAVSDRHFGVGADGLILICPSDKADARMRMFNADGSEAEMCGNGVRCVAKYLHDHGIVRKPALTVETGRGVLSLQLEVSGGSVRQVRVDMGEPILEAARIPTRLPGDPPTDVPLRVADYTLRVTCVSMGNPHCIAFVDQVTDALVLGVGPRVETHADFPRRTNVEFVRVNRPDDVTVRVWERGSGETLACGTGACAVAVAGVLTGRTQRRITAHLPGGELQLYWSETDNHVYLTGPAVEVFSGDWPASSRHEGRDANHEDPPPGAH
ncbi:MAG TPA: diaminopimelate epimerase [Gemmataceae bacterium]|nr:diaminopimelate epimerase [Gemmataceae bacterium]